MPCETHRLKLPRVVCVARLFAFLVFVCTFLISATITGTPTTVSLGRHFGLSYPLSEQAATASSPRSSRSGSRCKLDVRSPARGRAWAASVVAEQ